MDGLPRPIFGSAEGRILVEIPEGISGWRIYQAPRAFATVRFEYHNGRIVYHALEAIGENSMRAIKNFRSEIVVCNMRQDVRGASVTRSHRRLRIIGRILSRLTAFVVR